MGKMQERSDMIDKPEELGKSKKNYFQIDLLKAIMICFVIYDHSVHYTLRWGRGYELWERMAVPVFLIIMGFNMGKSFERKGYVSLKELYSWSYFKGKFWRFIFPYLIFYAIFITAGFLIYSIDFINQFNSNWILVHIFLGLTPFVSPGNWFIPILFAAILVMPLLYYSFSKNSVSSLIFCFAIEIIFHLLVFLVIGEVTSLAEWGTELYFRYNIFLYLSALGLGLWFSKEPDILNRKNLFVWILFPISLSYLIAWEFFGFRLAIRGASIVRGDYNYLVFPYSAFLILLVMKILPKNSETKMAKLISRIGKSTFHIYLTQELYFAISYALNGAPPIKNVFVASTTGLVNSFFFFINYAIIITIGVLWWYLENKIRNYRLYKKETKNSKFAVFHNKSI